MHSFLFLIVLLVTANLSWGQSPEDLVRDLRENTTSASRFMNALQKHAQYLDSANNGWYDSAALLGHILYRKDYRYQSSVIRVHAVYRGAQLGYVLISTYQEDTLFRYVNHDYTTQVLKDYNAAHNTDFTWVDLYEDNLYCFEGLPGLYEKRKLPSPEEVEKGIWWAWPSYITDEYEPLLVKRDHATIIKHCKSFNPARKAYGAFCLYILKKEGVPLSKEEEDLFEQISHSNETTELHGGCLAYPKVKLCSFLCREYLDPTWDELRMPSDLVRTVQSSLGSDKVFLDALKKESAEKKQKGDWTEYNAGAGLLDHKRILQRFNYSQRDWRLDSVIHTYVMVQAVYKGEKLRYVRLVEHYNIDSTGLFETRELMKYVDSVYANRILLPYNKKHKTLFDWKDLYEDELYRFETFGELQTIAYYDHPDGSGRDSVFLSGGMPTFWPMIRDLDHLAVVKNCKSINPVRKAYGLVCLYVWQQRGEILSLEEERLLKTIVKLKDTMRYQHGCRYHPAARFRDVLTQKELQRVYAGMYRVKPAKTQTSPQ